MKLQLYYNMLRINVAHREVMIEHSLDIVLEWKFAVQPAT